MWISYRDNIAHFTEGEVNWRDAYVCLCGFDLFTVIAVENSGSRKCKNCLRKLDRLNNKVIDFEKMETYFNL